MNKLIVKFDKHNIKIQRRNCCAHGVIVPFTVQNMVPGAQYLCTMTNISNGLINFKPNNFRITGIQQSETFVSALEMKDARVHIVKIRVQNVNNSSDVAEDIMTIECGDPQFFDVVFAQQNQIIRCVDQPNNIVAELTNLIPGNKYSYTLSALNDSQSIFLNFLPSTNTITAGSTNTNINSIVRYSGNAKSVIIKLTVTDQYNNFTKTAFGTLTCSN
jgi:hypothetical protein